MDLLPQENGVQSEPSPNTHDRLTYTSRFILEHRGDKPHVMEGRGNEFLELQEQPFVRKLQLGGVKKEVDPGWIEFPRYLCIENRTGMEYVSKPTPEQIQNDKRRIVLLFLDAASENAIEIPPGSVQMFCVKNFSSLRIQSQDPELSVPVTLNILSK